MTERLEEATKNLREGKFKQALNEYQAIVAADPQNALAFQGLGYAFCQLKRYDEAITAYRKALELNPRLAISHTHLGNIHYLRRQFPESEKEYRQAIELDPNAYAPLTNLGAILATQGRLEEAQIMVKRAIELAPTQVIPYCDLFEIFLLQKRFADAKEAVSRAFHLSPTLSTARQVVWAIARTYPKQIGYVLSLALTLILLIAYPTFGWLIGFGWVARGALESIISFRSGARKQAAMIAVFTLFLLVLVASAFLNYLWAKLN